MLHSASDRPVADLVDTVLNFRIP